MYKRYALLAATTLLCFAFPAYVHAEEVTTDSQPPSGYFLSGMDDTTPIGATYSMGLLFKDDVGPVDATVYLNSKPIKSGQLGMVYSTKPQGDDYYFNFNWDASKVSDGNFKLQIEMTDAAGNKAWVLSSPEKKNNFAVIQVQVPDRAPTAADSATTNSTSTTAKSTCKKSQSDVDAVVARITDRIDKQAELLHEAQDEIDKKDGLSSEQKAALGDADDDYAKFETKMTALRTRAINCSQDPKTGLATFKKSLAETKLALTTYRKDIKSLLTESTDTAEAKKKADTNETN